ncbi:uncharacterized protein LOC113272498 [Papaver somniferum]|uniref:uncharacterized protein LOC113272498 n=1 Tax=Papaver somniferum TaxID=3469 RepID=UPI000E6FF034|nr:uncharacterized protein LOC113272498 [Papaver somniferum]
MCLSVPGMNVLGCKWVYKIKLKEDVTLERHTDRLVVQGYNQIGGVDYEETFSPVVKPSTIRCVLSLALNKKWPIRKLDVSNAFLHGDLNEDVYMMLPPGFVSIGILLIKSGVKRILLVYVEEIILVGSSDDVLSTFITSLSAAFAMKHLGSLSYFLGMEALFTYNTNSLLLTQNKYSLELLKKFDMLECKPCKTPIAPGQRDSISDGTVLKDSSTYRSLVGGLQYLAFTRPDISYDVNYVSQFMHKPTDIHLQLLKRILRYIKGSLRSGITLIRGNCTTITAYSDSDWDGCPYSRRSTTGYCVFLGDNLVSWSSKKQPTIDHSSTEAEYKALVVAASEVRWISYILDELGVPLTTPCLMYCANMGARSLASNPVCHARTKHIEVDYHFVRSLVMIGFLFVKYVHTLDRIANFFIKGLNKKLFFKLQGKLMHYQSVQFEGGCKRT